MGLCIEHTKALHPFLNQSRFLLPAVSFLSVLNESSTSTELALSPTRMYPLILIETCLPCIGEDTIPLRKPQVPDSLHVI